MRAPFQLTPQAAEDLDAIWWFIAEDNRDAADRLEVERFFEFIAANIRLGRRRWPTSRAVRSERYFWS